MKINHLYIWDYTSIMAALLVVVNCFRKLWKSGIRVTTFHIL